ncbi:lipid IV(A) 3-deoxy-D-manno-octulosonic acid transferase [Aestuariirhabdus sp. Z084]|uniref:lipid IV(A) 3-deoxy-D-manno-octulosonic acid transferase n=1 Tax=Aestuariirhabdus haliotis TaxID=2918751 RepID=UPI00201B44BF|nr:lipid IV(A) 3-deoxy-D-manno-octulosonic acid transferase [Aestuariirhabdus haliotis]MCL6415609.1 lipid IV(A) 3-deoxy-D-manno-octulosonic acid transferase [Aestuariirhabdus haliotis]MCL6419604.1 lipid IV(A) 3-deoxy-D-manno-octulosonic acid transferase [Aestuariirhabdus haliotis]
MVNRFSYSLLFYLLVPFVGLRLLYRAWRAPLYARRWAERFGWFDASSLAGKPVLWVHSVSVGESIAAAPLVKGLQRQYPSHQLVVTTMTPTGSERVKALYGDTVFHVYAPYDLPDAVARFMRSIRPQLAVIMETELWPNTVAACHKQGVPVLLANARLSARSARGYARFPALVGPMMKALHVAAQSEEAAERFRQLGVSPDRVQVTGSLKFDLGVDDAVKQQGVELRQQWLMNQKPETTVIVAASTHQGEDEQVLDAITGLDRPALLVLVPRHPERFGKVAELLSRRGLKFARRSRQEAVNADTTVVLADTMGEMLRLLAAADIAFIGGSLVPTGGHNMLEASVLGVPVLSGPHLFNFQEISDQLVQAKAMKVVQDAVELGQALRLLVSNPAALQDMGAAGHAVVERNKGALQNQLEMCGHLITGARTD